jgi:DNA polymerase type B, organellar and viral
MIKKGVYPYDYIDDFNKLYTSYLPNINEFDSKLNKSKCSKEDYDQAKTVWNKFNCKNLLDYHNIYLKSDVLLLSDIWFNFSKVNYKNYGLDVSYYYTAPSLAFDAMLKETEVKLDLLTNIEMS